MFGLGMGELILVGIIALLFVGPKKLPELAKGLGKGIRDFQNAAKGFTEDIKNSDETPKPHHAPNEVVVDAKVADAPQQLEDLKEAAHGPESKPHNSGDHHS